MLKCKFHAGGMNYLEVASNQSGTFGRHSCNANLSMENYVFS